MPSINDPMAFDVIGAHRIDVSEIGDDDSVFPFNYERDGRQTFPFFSSKEGAEEFFAGTNPPPNLTLFQPYCVLAGFVATPENEIFDLILDPDSESEHKISPAERLLIRSVSTPAT